LERHWRYTLNRKNHPEEKKLCLFHTSSLFIASPLHIKWRNQEVSHAVTRCQHPDGLGRCRQQGELSGTRYSHNLGPDQPGPLDRPTPTQGKKEKLNNKQNNKKDT
jgi:hypothetical protein